MSRLMQWARAMFPAEKGGPPPVIYINPPPFKIFREPPPGYEPPQYDEGRSDFIERGRRRQGNWMRPPREPMS